MTASWRASGRRRPGRASPVLLRPSPVAARRRSRSAKDCSSLQRLIEKLGQADACGGELAIHDRKRLLVVILPEVEVPRERGDDLYGSRMRLQCPIDRAALRELGRILFRKPFFLEVAHVFAPV